MIPLTICIPSLRERSASLCTLLQSLAAQPRAEEVEVLVAVDGRQAMIGAKRNQLVASARGRYVAHVDDDDSVSPLYIPTILEAIDRAPDVDAILIRGERINTGEKVLEFDYEALGKWAGYRREQGPWVGGGSGITFWKPIDHLCAVRTEIARAVPYQDCLVNEDVEWAIAVAPRIRTFARTEGVLYTYCTYAGRERDRRLWGQQRCFRRARR